LKVGSKKFLNNTPIYLLLIISSIITPLLVSRQFTSIHDLAYFLSNSLRIFNGQIVYKDFIEVHSPGSYYISVYLFKIFGINYLPTYLWMFVVNIISTFCIYKIIQSLTISKNLKVAGVVGFALLGPYSFFSQIWYDSDSLFFLILNIYILQLNIKKNNSNTIYFISGILSFIPFFFKQNIGVVTVFALNIWILFLYKSIFRNKMYFFFGQISALSIFLINLVRSNSLDDWFFYNFTYATLARFTSPITDIFPIRFITKYNYDLKFEALYYIFYLILCSICLKAFLSIFKKNIDQHIFLQILIIIFSLIIYFDNLIFVEIIRFLNNFMNISTNTLDNSRLSILFFLIFSIIGLFFVNFKIQVEILIQKYIQITTVFIFLFFVSFIYKMLFTENIQGRSQVSYEYYLKILFFIYFPVMLISLFIGLKEKERYALLTIPFLGYLYGTSLSQGVAGSTAACIGIILYLYLLIFDYFEYKYNQKIKFYSNSLTLTFTIFLFLTAIFGSKYHFIQYEDSVSNFSSFDFLTLPSGHFDQQKDAEILLAKYEKEYPNNVFVPEATTAYFSNQSNINVDVHTFDTTTNPYGVIFETESLKYFLECNNVQIVFVNTNPHRKYFKQFISNDEKISSYLGENYFLIDEYNDFKIYKQKIKAEKKEYCNLQQYLSEK
tara:strand:+ start:3579 stop:5573 length:1995 start_codon:yes stop_codon:yes gene_type:complete